MLIEKVKNKVRAFVQFYGTDALKGRQWNNEFLHGRWDCLDSTSGDCVYPFIEKYANGGNILDLGCGSGSTGNELLRDSYQSYMGIDISDVAITKSQRRTIENGREDRNRFLQSDVFSYVPDWRFDVILFRDSIYYVPRAKIKQMLDRYSAHLKPDGVFVVRMWDGNNKYKGIVELIEDNFEIVAKRLFEEPNAAVLVFRK